MVKNIIYVLSLTLLVTIYQSIGRMNDFDPIIFVSLFLLVISALIFNLLIIFLSRRYKYLFLLILFVNFMMIFIMQDNKDQLVLYTMFGIFILISILHYLIYKILHYLINNRIINKQDGQMSLNVYLSSYNSVLIIAVLMDYVWNFTELISNDTIYIDIFESITILVIFNFLYLIPLERLKKIFHLNGIK